MATIKDVRAAAKKVGAAVGAQRTHGGMKEIEALAPDGKTWRASGASILVGHHGKDFAAVCQDVIDRMADGFEES